MCISFQFSIAEFIRDIEDSRRWVKTQRFIRVNKEQALQIELVFLRPPMAIIGHGIDITQHGLSVQSVTSSFIARNHTSRDNYFLAPLRAKTPLSYENDGRF